MSPQDRVAIVTGASSGIGAACAKALAAHGCNVLINYQSNESGAREVLRAVESHGVGGLIVQGNVADDATCRRIAAAAKERWGRIDVLVNNAAMTRFVPQDDLEGLSAGDFQDIYAVNVVGAYQMIRACLPAMRQQGSAAVINVASTAALTGIASSTAYAASKGALVTMTKSLARVLGPELRINAVCPGFVDTPWNSKGHGAEQAAKLKGVLEKSTALRITASAEDVADAIVWLAQGARAMTGEILQLDGGFHLGPPPRPPARPPTRTPDTAE